jgi:hypothetical protein
MEINMNFIAQFFHNWKLKKQKIAEALELKSKLEQEASQTKLDRQVIMDSAAPWYKLIGKPYSIDAVPTEPVSERYEYNKAWITSLREQGYKGETDSQVISDWEVKTEETRVKRLLELDREKKKNSSEPWVEVVSEKYDESTKQVEMKLDWNGAFIKMLRVHGYTGNNEQEIVDKWFQRLSQDIAAELHDTTYE